MGELYAADGMYYSKVVALQLKVLMLNYVMHNIFNFIRRTSRFIIFQYTETNGDKLYDPIIIIIIIQ